jgi:hypothetical protein
MAADSNSPWYKNYWRRILVDAHIPDWDVRFLSKWEPKEFVDNLERAHVSAAMIYANSHVGLCYWPTKSGAMHKGLKGRDIAGEIISECRRRGMATIAYYSLIFNNWAYVNHPEWRIIPAGPRRWHPRYGTCCPNSAAYQDFVTAQIEEFFSAYPVNSVFYDMTFWPELCVCPNCINRCLQDIGIKPLTEPDWANPDWLKFQRWRESCILNFAKLATDTTRRVRPEVTVTHQFSTVLYDWGNGVPFGLADYCDYLSGDFYGDAAQQSVACKAYYAISKEHSFEFMTTANVSLFDHVTLKSRARLKAQASLALAHSAPFVLIDAINPDGTQNRATYDLIGSVFEEMEKYEPFLGGEMRADVGVYFSQESKFNPGGDSSEMPHFQAVRGACRALQRAHIPYGLATRRNLEELSSYQVIVLPDVLLMDEKEAEAIREFVRRGGSLYASCRSGSCHKSGRALPEFLLADLLGISLLAEGRLSFLRPVVDSLKQVLAPQDFLTHKGPCFAVKAEGAQVLASRALPWTETGGGNAWGGFSSIHSNPPGPVGSEPALTRSAFGKGMCIYSAAAIEGVEEEVNVRLFAAQIRGLLQRPPWFEAEAHPSVEITYFDQPDNRRAILNAAVFQADFPNAPVDIILRARLPEGMKPKEVLLLPDGRPLEWDLIKGDCVEFRLSQVSDFAMIAVGYQG